MSRRQLVIAAALALAALAVAWYTGVLAPGGAAGPSGPVQVVVSATATGNAGWVRYLINVKNVADGDFDGDLLLIDLEDLADQRGGTLSSLVQPPRLHPAPAVAAQSAYQVHAVVPSRRARTVTVIAPNRFNYVQAVAGGQVLAEGPVERQPYLPVAVLSDLEVAADAVDHLRFDRVLPRVAAFGSAREFPQSALFLAGYSVVVIDQLDTATLSAAQVQALRDFVGLGGTLVLAGGPSWRRTLAPLPSDLLPLHPTATQTVSLRPLAELAGVEAPDLEAPAAIGFLARGARSLLAGPQGIPLEAQLPYGWGQVLELAYDPAAEPVAGTSYAALGWSQAIGRALRQLPGAGPTASWLPSPEPAFTGLLPQAGDAPLPPLQLVAGVLLLYLVLVGPVSYWLLRRRLRRPTLFWFTVPLTAATFATAFYAIGQALEGTLQVRQLQVIKVGPDQTASVLEYDRVLFLRRGVHAIDPGPGSLAAPLTLDTFRVTGSACERCTSQLQGLPSGAERVLPGPRPIVLESGVVYGGVRVVGSTRTLHVHTGLEAHLSVRGGRLVGRVVNLGRDPVVDLTLYTYDGQAFEAAPVASLLAAGEATGVDTLLQPAVGLSGQPLPVRDLGTLVQAVGMTALATQGDAVLVGLTRPLPSAIQVDGSSPPGWALAVLEQPVRLEAADALLPLFESRQLASSSGDSIHGFTAVYDISFPSTSAPLALTVSHQWPASVEVYNWVRGTFEQVELASGDSGTAPLPLSPEQVAAGMVRVRLKEPRLRWGSTMVVDVASAESQGPGSG